MRRKVRTFGVVNVTSKTFADSLKCPSRRPCWDIQTVGHARARGKSEGCDDAGRWRSSVDYCARGRIASNQQRPHTPASQRLETASAAWSGDLLERQIEAPGTR